MTHPPPRRATATAGPPRRGRRPGGTSLRARLALLVVASVLPLIAFGLGAQYTAYRAERAQAGQRALQLARALSLVVEGELRARMAALRVLALSPALRTGDFAAFRAEAEASLAQQFPRATILLLREDGQQLVNTALPAGAAPPIRRHLDTLRQVFATARPAVSNLYDGVALRRPVVAVEVPVPRAGGGVAYSLALNPSIDAFGEVIRRQNPPEGWVVTVVDRDARVVARNPDPERFIGQRAPPPLLQRLLAEREGVVETVSLDGIPVLTGFSRGEVSGWSVVVGVPRAELTGPAVRSALLTAAAGGGMLLLGLALARAAARRISRPIEALRRLAAASDGDAPLAAGPTGLPEADEVAAALRASAERRRAAEAERARSEAEQRRAVSLLAESEERLRTATDNARVGLAVVGREHRYRFANRAYAEISGLPADAPGLVGRRVAEVLAARYEAHIRPRLERALGGERVSYEPTLPAPSPGGEERHLAVTYEPGRTASGEAVVVVVVTDVTQRVAAARALAQSEGLLRLALEASHLGTWRWEVGCRERGGGGELVWDARCRALFGLPPDAPVSHAGWAAALRPQDRAVAEAAVTRALDPDDPDDGYACEYRAVQPAGRVIWLAATGRAIFAPDPTARAGRRALRLLGTIRDITGRKRAEARRRLLLHELNHRAKNTLTIVQSIAAQTLRGTDPAVREGFEARLLALAAAHDVLTRENWEAADLRDVADGALAPYAGGDAGRGDGRGGGRLRVHGPPVRLRPQAALSFALALNELATNALKYGALSEPEGRVELGWQIVPGPVPRLCVVWSERGGPPVAPPGRRGFGTRLIERSLAQELGGTAEIAYAPSGVVCVIEAPLAAAEAAEVAGGAAALPPVGVDADAGADVDGGAGQGGRGAGG